MWPFAEAVKANVTSIMCSYNKLDSLWACENEALLTSILKDELDFQGYVVSGKKELADSVMHLTMSRLDCSTHHNWEC